LPASEFASLSTNKELLDPSAYFGLSLSKLGTNPSISLSANISSTLPMNRNLSKKVPAFLLMNAHERTIYQQNHIENLIEKQRESKSKQIVTHIMKEIEKKYENIRRKFSFAINESSRQIQLMEKEREVEKDKKEGRDKETEREKEKEKDKVKDKENDSISILPYIHDYISNLSKESVLSLSTQAMDALLSIPLDSELSLSLSNPANSLSPLSIENQFNYWEEMELTFLSKIKSRILIIQTISHLEVCCTPSIYLCIHLFI
jgi:hypothetical protein